MKLAKVITNTKQLKSKTKKTAPIANHYVEFIEVTMNETMLCQTNDKAQNCIENCLWILQLFHLYTALCKGN